jgi:hypothetical protein
MDIVFLVALGVVLGALVLAYLPEILAFFVVGLGLLLAVAVVLGALGVAFFLFSDADRVEYAGWTFALVAAMALFAWALVDVAEFLEMEAYARGARQRARKAAHARGDAQSNESVQRELAESEFFGNPFILQRRTSVGWVTVFGSNIRSAAFRRLKYNFTSRIFYFGRQRVVHHNSTDGVEILAEC